MPTKNAHSLMQTPFAQFAPPRHYQVLRNLPINLEVIAVARKSSGMTLSICVVKRPCAVQWGVSLADCESRPATVVPVGSSRSDDGDNEIVEAFDATDRVEGGRHIPARPLGKP